MSEQPLPTAGEGPVLWELVIEDMRRRHQVGIERYGVPLRAFNGRNAMRDIREEMLDFLVYLKQLELELEVVYQERDCLRQQLAAQQTIIVAEQP